MNISSVVDSSFPSSQATESEVAPPMGEPLASSQETPSPSSQAAPQSSESAASEPSHPETSTIPFSRGLPTEQDCDSKNVTTSLDAKIIQNEINFISKSNQQLIVDYTVVQYYGSTPKGVKRIIPLQVKKSDMQGITEIVPQAHEMKLKKDEVRLQTDDPFEFVD